MDKKKSGSKEYYKFTPAKGLLKEVSRVTGADIHGAGNQEKHVDLTPKQCDKWIKFAFLPLAGVALLFIWAIGVLC